MSELVLPDGFHVKFALYGKTAVILEEFTLAGITVPAGFRSDGISAPRWAWVKFHPFGEYCPAAFVHDYCIGQYGYAVARDKFLEAVREIGAIDRETFLLYNAVRLKDWHRRNFEK